MAFIPKDYQRFRIDGPNIVPQYIKATPAIAACIEQLLDCFRYAAGETYGALRESCEALCTENQRHRLIRGIAHVLESRVTFHEPPQADIVALRMEIFARAAKIGAEDFADRSRRRDALLDDVAQEFRMTRAALEDCLYADLKDERQIASFDDADAEEIIAEYNLALSKSLLMYARTLVFTIVFDAETAQNARKLFQSLKFFNLLFDVSQITETAWQFTVDGPSAVLAQPQKYAMSLACFLPTLYQFASWHATAALCVDGKNVTWQLKPDDFAPPKLSFPQRLPEEAQRLAQRLREIDPNVAIDDRIQLIDLGRQSVWVPDFSVAYKGSDRKICVEVVGFWRADYLNRRIAAVNHPVENLIIVLSDKLKTDKTALAASALNIVHYKRTPRPQDVLKMAKRLGQWE